MKVSIWLRTLQARGSLPFSQIPARDRETIEQLITMRLVRIEAKQYQRRVVVTDLVAFAHWIEAILPGEPEVGKKLLPRAENIARTRSSKGGTTTHYLQPILLRWFGNDLHSEPAQCTQLYGLFACTSDTLSRLPLPPSWYLLLVENWESFISFQDPGCDVLLVVLSTGGQIADITLQAIHNLIPAPDCVLHFGDLDWSGLRIFLRVKAAIPSAKLYIPPHLDDLLRQYGNRDLLITQTPIGLETVTDPDLLAVIEAVSRANAGLEQEIIQQPTRENFY